MQISSVRVLQIKVRNKSAEKPLIKAGPTMLISHVYVRQCFICENRLDCWPCPKVTNRGRGTCRWGMTLTEIKKVRLMSIS